MENFDNPAARSLLQCMVSKQTNLCISVDLVEKDKVLSIVDAVGPFVCLIKVGCLSLILQFV